MPTVPTENIEFASADLNNGPGGSPNKTPTSAGKRTNGWDHDESPPRDYFNYWQNAVWKWVTYLRSSAALASERVYRVDPIKGVTAANGANGFGIPFSTYSEAVAALVAARGETISNAPGVDGQMWGISIAPGEISENIIVPGWVVVFAEFPRTVRIKGGAAGAPVIELRGSNNSASPSPCAIHGLRIQRLASEHAALSKAADNALYVTGGAGDFGYDIDSATVTGDGFRPRLALVEQCEFELNSLSHCVKSIADSGATDPARFAGFLIESPVIFRNCVIEGDNLENAAYTGLDACAITVDGGWLRFEDTIFSSHVEPPQIIGGNMGVKWPQGLYAQHGYVLCEFADTDYRGKITDEIDDGFLTAHGLGTGDAPYNFAILNDGSNVATVGITNSTTNVSAANFGFTIRNRRPGTISTSVIANKSTVKIDGAATGKLSVAEMTSGNLSNGAAVNNPSGNLDNLLPDLIKNFRSSGYVKPAPVTAGGTTLRELIMNIARSTSFVIAPSNASAMEKSLADYICDGTADEAEINAALLALTNGGRIVLLPGAYSITNPIVMAAGAHISGTGGATVLTLSGSSTGNLFTLASGDDYCRIENLVLVGRSGSTAKLISVDSVNYADIVGCKIGAGGVHGGVALYVKDSSFVRIEDCDIDAGTANILITEACAGIYVTDTSCGNATANGIQITSSGGENPTGIYMSRCAIYNATADGININAGCLQIEIVNCIVSDCTSDGISISGATNILISGGSVENCAEHGVAVSDCEDIRIVGGLFVSGCGDETHYGVWASVCVGLVVGDIRVRNCLSHGLYAIDCRGATIDNPQCQDNAWSGIYILGSAGGCEGLSVNNPSVHENGKEGIYLAGCNRVTINGGACHGNGASSANTYPNIYLSSTPATCDYCTVKGVTCSKFDFSETAKSKYGIHIAAGSDNNYVINNDLYLSGVTGALQDDGTANITVHSTSAGNRVA